MRGATNLLPPNRQAQTVREIAGQYPGSYCVIDVIDSDEDFGLATINIAAGLPSPPDEPVLPGIAGAQVAAIAFTSGSTGKPVANEKHWFTLCGTAAMLAQRFAPPGSPRPAIVATVPSQHMYGLEMTVMMALQGSCAIDSGHPFYAEDVAAALAQLAPPRLLVTTPVHLRHLLGSGMAMPVVERLVSATAPLARDVASAGEALFTGNVDEIFGCTEAGSIATRHTASEEDWRLLDGMTIADRQGVIQVTGPQLAAATALQDRMLLLGPDRFRFLGRSADMINVGGKRASLSDLAAKLLEIEGVSDGVVFMPRGAQHQRPAALVVSDLSARQIARLLARRIDPVLLPRPIKKVAAIPRNETGKAPDRLLQEALGLGDE
jgi:acyl-coenzyme A synthetase/AMP-(fatty) acid ligase